MLTATEFTRQLMGLREQYRADNAWVGNWRTGSWNDENTMAHYIHCAYNLYRATATNMLKLTLLGGTQIRLDDAYIRNFGITGANGIQDRVTKEHVYAEVMRRIGRTTNPSPTADRNPAAVVRSGSILSEKGWTPILNDALIIGAACGRQQFALALTSTEQLRWERINGDKVTRFAVNASRFGETPALKNAWKSFFNASKKMFFDGGNPRVFARELLGLYFFGYTPEYSWHQLVFRPPQGGVVRPTFNLYLDQLRNVNFHTGDKTRIMQAISDFLFNEPEALGQPWTRRVVAV